jgi:peptidoglycan/LPS O-acetylase OafA/YrhL
MIVTTVSIFYLLKDYAKIHFKKLISVLAQHSYTVYMIHMLILDKMYAQFKGLDFLNNFYMYADWFARYVAVCIIVIIFAVLIDKLIFNPITNMIQKRILH